VSRVPGDVEHRGDALVEGVPGPGEVHPGERPVVGTASGDEDVVHLTHLDEERLEVSLVGNVEARRAFRA
jgi:hypothetical protein